MEGGEVSNPLVQLDQRDRKYLEERYGKVVDALASVETALELANGCTDANIKIGHLEFVGRFLAVATSEYSNFDVSLCSTVFRRAFSKRHQDLGKQLDAFTRERDALVAALLVADNGHDHPEFTREGTIRAVCDIFLLVIFSIGLVMAYLDGRRF